MKEYFEYTLKTPIKISKDGEYVDASDVVVYAPRPRDKYKVLKLEADLNNAFLSVLPKLDALDALGKKKKKQGNDNGKGSEDDKKDDEVGMGSLIIKFADADIVVSIMYNLEQIFLAGTEDKPTITIDGIQMKKTHFDDGLDSLDLKALAGGYADHFLSLAL
jgi:hypothetical protein